MATPAILLAQLFAGQLSEGRRSGYGSRFLRGCRLTGCQQADEKKGNCRQAGETHTWLF